MNPADPTTPPEILASLATSPLDEVRRAVAANPNTPVKVLNKIWDKFPDAMLANPILIFWELTDPRAFEANISLPARLASYNHLRKTGGELSPHIHKLDSLKMAMNHAFSNCDTRVFQHAPHDPLVEIRLLFLQTAIYYSSHAHFFHDKAPHRVWKSLATDPQPEVRRNFAKLMRSISWNIDAANPEFDKAARTLASCDDGEVLIELANCPPVPADVVRSLASNESPAVRLALSKCANTPPDAIERLCNDAEEDVRLAFASACRHVRAHEILLKDPSEKVRAALAANHRVSRGILLGFDLGDKPSVLKQVFLNSRAGESLRARIFQEAHADTKEVIANNSFRLTPRFYFANKNNIPPSVRKLLSKRNGLHVEIASDLACDQDEDVRLQIARRLRGQHCWRNTAAVSDMLERFVKDPAKEIRRYICTDLRLTSELTAQLARDVEPEIRLDVLEDILRRLEDCRNCKAYGRFMSLYNATRHLFIEAANDTSGDVRSHLASVRETPPKALGILFDDPVDEIRESARAHTQWPFGAVLDFERYHPRFKGPTRHGYTTPSSAVLHIFAACDNPFLRQLTARCSRSRLADLRDLAMDSHPFVREAAEEKLAQRNPSNAQPNPIE